MFKWFVKEQTIPNWLLLIYLWNSLFCIYAGIRMAVGG